MNYYLEKNEYVFDKTSVAVITIDRQYIEEHADEMVSLLHLARREKVERFNNMQAKAVSIAAGRLLEDVIYKLHGISPENIEVALNENGKPLIKGLPEFNYNLSHSGDKVAIAYGPNPVGVDIEFIQKAPERVATRCFLENEITYINFNNQTNQQERFARIWTMKESYLKCTGTGISIPLNSFEVDPLSHTVKNSPFVFNEVLNTPYILMLCTKQD